MTTTITGITKAWFEWDLDEYPGKLVWMIETELETNPLAEGFDADQISEMLEKIQGVIDENGLGVAKVVLR